MSRSLLPRTEEASLVYSWVRVVSSDGGRWVVEGVLRQRACWASDHWAVESLGHSGRLRALRALLFQRYLN